MQTIGGVPAPPPPPGTEGWKRLVLSPAELLELMTGIGVLQLATEAVAGRADGLNVAYQKVVQNRNRAGAKPRVVLEDATPGAERILVYIPPDWSPPR